MVKEMKRDRRKGLNRRYIDRSATIARIFKEGEKNFDYITNNAELLKEHENFIRHSPYSSNSALRKLTVPSGVSKGLHPRIFDHFDKRYPAIHERWVHMVRSCLDETYPSYKFFGAKGVYISERFLDSKFFCVWCLRNGLTSKLGLYDKYLLRKKKHKNYSPTNCYVTSEKEIHECKGLKNALNSLYIIKRYEEQHHPTVSYMIMYSRYYIWDWSLEDALMVEYSDIRKIDQFGFSPTNFYNSVATEDSCTLSVFLSRIHYYALTDGLILRPYDMLKPEYSIDEECAKLGIISYKKRWDRNRKEQENKCNVYSNISQDEQAISLKNDVTDVYSYNKDLDVYSK